MTERRIITVDIGRSTWQGYASEAPRIRRDPNQTVGSFVGMSKDDADELLGLMDEAFSKLTAEEFRERKLIKAIREMEAGNIINLGEGI